MEQAQEPLLVTLKGAVAVLTLNTPRSLNALSEQMLLALQTALDDVAQDGQVKVVILKSGGDHFCAGHDLKEMTARRGDEDNGLKYFQELFALCSKVMTSVVRLPQPVIAQVNGVATAAGCQLVASCDLAVASQTARFATPGVNIGLFCSTPMVALSRNVGRKHAMEMLLLGIGGCASFDVLSILKKSRQNVVDCRCEIQAERADAVPAVFTKIHLEFFVTGQNLKPAQVARAVELSATKYCSASIMMAGAGVAVSHGYQVVEPD